MKKCYFKITSIIFVSSLFFISCNKEIEDEIQREESVVDYYSLIQRLGFDSTTAIEEADYFLIEGDIKIEKDELLNYFKIPSTRQARSEFIVSLENRKDIKIYISSLIPDKWKTATRNAMDNWNSQKVLNMREVSTGNADIYINIETLGDNYVAFAQFPTDKGKAGNSIVINSKAAPDFDLSQATLIMTHELGHCIGFRHTNWADNKEDPGIGIEGTPNSGSNPDPGSIMNWDVGKNKLSWNGFSYYDKIAIANLYPTWIYIGDGKYSYFFSKTVDVKYGALVPISGDHPTKSVRVDMTLIKNDNRITVSESKTYSIELDQMENVVEHGIGSVRFEGNTMNYSVMVMVRDKQLPKPGQTIPPISKIRGVETYFSEILPLGI